MTTKLRNDREFMDLFGKNNLDDAFETCAKTCQFRGMFVDPYSFEPHFGFEKDGRKYSYRVRRAVSAQTYFGEHYEQSSYLV